MVGQFAARLSYSLVAPQEAFKAICLSLYASMGDKRQMLFKVGLPGVLHSLRHGTRFLDVATAWGAVPPWLLRPKRSAFPNSYYDPRRRQ